MIIVINHSDVYTFVVGYINVNKTSILSFLGVNFIFFYHFVINETNLLSITVFKNKQQVYLLCILADILLIFDVCDKISIDDYIGSLLSSNEMSTRVYHLAL